MKKDFLYIVVISIIGVSAILFLDYYNNEMVKKRIKNDPMSIFNEETRKQMEQLEKYREELKTQQKDNNQEKSNTSNNSQVTTEPEQKKSSNNTLVCTSTEKDNRDYYDKYVQTIKFENNIFVSYEMKSIYRYKDVNKYNIAKADYSEDNETIFDNANYIITTYAGNGYASTNGTEDIIKNKSLTEIKQMTEIDGYSSVHCEVY